MGVALHNYCTVTGNVAYWRSSACAWEFGLKSVDRGPWNVFLFLFFISFVGGAEIQDVNAWRNIR
jgi:hypothetical protein